MQYIVFLEAIRFYLQSLIPEKTCFHFESGQNIDVPVLKYIDIYNYNNSIFINR